MSLVEADEVEQIAIQADGRIRPFSAARAGELHEQAAARISLDIAAGPVTALAAAMGKIEAADRLGVRGQPPRKLGSANS